MLKREIAIPSKIIIKRLRLKTVDLKKFGSKNLSNQEIAKYNLQQLIEKEL